MRTVWKHYIWYVPQASQQDTHKYKLFLRNDIVKAMHSASRKAAIEIARFSFSDIHYLTKPRKSCLDIRVILEHYWSNVHYLKILTNVLKFSCPNNPRSFKNYGSQMISFFNDLEDMWEQVLLLGNFSKH